MPRAFLSAEWRDLLLLNYEVPAEALSAFVPRGVRLDAPEGRCFVSLVGFRMLDARLLGVSVPWHRDFEEVNLRLYVARGERRGVAFVKEIVPRRALAWVARLAYNERYHARRMSHVAGPGWIEFAWREGRRECRFGARPAGSWALPAEGSHERFIVDHLFGYARQRDGGTVEYEVEHPLWRVRPAADVRVDVDFERAYGGLGRHLAGPPASALFAEGSPVRVARPRRLPS